jgi:hypothetical protein
MASMTSVGGSAGRLPPLSARSIGRDPARRIDAQYDAGVAGRLGAGRIGSRLVPALRSAAGPASIVVGVLVVLRDLAFAARLTTQHVDILTFWLPNHCFLGRSLASGEIPAWNPHVMGGVPFAADPQSGWMYLPAMALYALLPCHRAAVWFITLNPLIAGLGMYAFLRTERTSRAAATAGGLVLSLLMADSTIALELPFAGAVAWTTVTLACSARYLRASDWAGRLPWAGLTGLAWSQLAAAHLSHGMVVGTAALVVYMLAKLLHAIRSRARTPMESLAMAGSLLSIIPLAALAYLWPRLSYLSESTIGLGYRRFAEMAGEVAGRDPGHSVAAITGGLPVSWPLGLAVSPGPYLGAAASALSLAGWWDPRRRHLAMAFAAFALASYAASLHAVSTALGRWIGSWPLAGFYLHAPGRLRYGTLLAIPILVGFGADAWIRADRRRGWLLLLPGVALWWLAPLAAGVQRSDPWLFVAGALAAGGLLAVTVRRPAARLALAWLVPVAIALELTASGLLGQVPAYSRTSGEKVRTPLTGILGPMGRATVDAAAYTEITPIARTIQEGDGGRYLALGPAGWDRVTQLRDPSSWGLLSNQRSILFELEDVEGYNPSQLPRYWTFVRAVDPRPMRYNASSFRRLGPALQNLLQLEWVILRASEPPPALPSVPVARDGRWVLYRLLGAPRRATVLTSWTEAGSETEALEMVTDPGFDPNEVVILEGLDGGPDGTPGPSASARYESTGPGSGRVEVSTPVRAVVLIRTPFAKKWRATVDSRPVDVLPADYLLQGVPVDPGDHTVVLRYEDPAIGRGLVGSAATLLGIATATVALRRRGRPGLRRSANGNHGAGQSLHLPQ